MGSKFLRLLVLLLGFSHLLSLNATPVTRTKNLVHGYNGHVISDDNHLVLFTNSKSHMEKRRKVNTLFGRMNYEVNDYPGSGANNRHTPRRGNCIEC